MRRADRVAVGMATYRRPHALARLVEEILDQIDDFCRQGEIVPSFTVIVVDNDEAGSGRGAATASGDRRVRYVVEPRPGISAARNRILDEAGDCDVLVLIDDDELPQAGWLAHLLDAYVRFDADAVSGPVRAVFRGGSDPWIEASGAYRDSERHARATGMVIGRAATNNLLLDMRTVRRLELRFDDDMGLTGGEDSLFTGQLTRAGGRIVWCAEALVDDQVPTERNTRDYSLRRRFATSATHVRVEQRLLDPGPQRLLGLARWLAIGAGQIVKGTGLALWGRLVGMLGVRARGERKMASGLGVLAGCLGRVPSPYARRQESP